MPGSESGYSFASAGPYAVPGDTGAVGILLEKPVGPVLWCSHGRPVWQPTAHIAYVESETANGILSP